MYIETHFSCRVDLFHLSCCKNLWENSLKVLKKFGQNLEIIILFFSELDPQFSAGFLIQIFMLMSKLTNP